MPSVITDAGRALIAAKLGAEEVLAMTEVRYGNPVVSAVVQFDAAAVVDAGGGLVDLPATVHGVPVGSDVRVFGTDNYNARYVSQAGGGADHIRVIAEYIAEVLTVDSKANAVFAPDPEATDQDDVVHVGGAPSASRVNDNQVLYASVLDTAVGDFDITQVGYWHVEGMTETLVILSNVPLYRKRAVYEGVQGNFFRNSAIMVISRAAEAAGVTLPPETWSYDFSQRLRNGDERHRQALNRLLGRFASLGSAQLVAEIAPVLQDACDVDDDWVASSGAIVEDAADKVQGAASLEISGHANNATQTKTLGAPEDWTAYNGLLVALKGSSATNMHWFIEDSLGNRSHWDVVNQDDWADHEIDFSAPSGNNGTDSDLSDVLKFGIGALDNGVTYNLDNIRKCRLNDFGLGAGVSAIAGLEFQGAATAYAGHRAAWSTPGEAAALAPPGVGTRTDTVYLDLWFEGDFNTKRAFAQVTVDDDPLTDYEDANGVQHYVEALAEIERTTAKRITAAMITDQRRVIADSDSGSIQEMIDAAIAALIGGAPGALDTLNELAAALADDENFAATMVTALAGKQAISEKDQLSGYAGLDGAGKLNATFDAAKATSGVFDPARIGDLDAAKITTGTFPQARIGAAAIGQAELKTDNNIATYSGVVNNDGIPVTNSFALLGGEFGFYPRLRKTAGGAATSVGYNLAQTGVTSSSFDSYAQANRTNSGGSSTTVGVAVDQRFIIACPPYDLGDGEVPLFIFVWIKGGKVYGTWDAYDPPWAHSGPTSIRPTHKRGDQMFRAVPRLPAKPEDPRLLAQWAQDCAARDDQDIDLVEITQAVKQADMPLIPHPFLRNEFTAEDRIVLVDPCSPILKQCAKLRERGIDLSELLHSGALYIDPDSKPLNRAGPPGVDVVSIAWRDPII